MNTPQSSRTEIRQSIKREITISYEKTRSGRGIGLLDMSIDYSITRGAAVASWRFASGKRAEQGLIRQ